jgi:hypothetical protein
MMWCMTTTPRARAITAIHRHSRGALVITVDTTIILAAPRIPPHGKRGPVVSGDEGLTRQR